MTKHLYEILVPRYTRNQVSIKMDLHREWDRRVKEMTGGLTILKSGIGYWVCPEPGETVREQMIPVRIFCTEAQIEAIATLTLNFYSQDKVMYYLVAEHVHMMGPSGKEEIN